MELQKYEQKQYDAPMTVEQLVGQVNLIQKVMSAVMKDNEHFGIIPGCGKKPSLLQPGAQKLLVTFRLAPEYSITEKPMEHGHREYQVLCSLKTIGSGGFVGQGAGSASTMEGKWRFRVAPKKLTDRPVPKAYWDLRQSDPKGAQEAIGGKGFSTQKDENGVWMISEGTSEKVEHDNPADYYNCVTPETKVLTHDLQWIPAGELESGDMLIGVEENMTNEYSRHFSVGEATVHGRKVDDLYEVKTEDGRIVRCNGEHKWLVKKSGSKGTEWVSTLDIHKEINDKQRRHRNWRIMSVCHNWEEDKSRSGGYVAGLLDADGSLGSTQLLVLFAQQENTVLSLFRQEMQSRGFQIGTSPCRTDKTLSESTSKKQVYSVRILGGFAEQLRLLGTIRPARLLERWLNLWDLQTRRLEGRGSGSGSPAKLVSVTSIGKGEIVLLGTSCRTYIAEGLICHNTVLKMACKRALVAATLTATAASDIFTQDVEELVENFKVAAEPAAAPPQRPPQVGKPFEQTVDENPSNRATETKTAQPVTDLTNATICDCILESFKEVNSKPDAPKPWKAFFCKFSLDGQEFEAGTFDKKIGEKLDALQGGEVSLAYKPGSKAGKFEIISIEPADLIP